MTNVQFTEFQCHDDRPSFTREEAIERVLAFSGIHEHTALSWLCETFSAGCSDISTISEYSFGYEESTWAIDPGGFLSGDAPDTTQWYKILYTGNTIDVGFEISFDKTGSHGGFIFCADTSYNPALMAWWTDTHVGFSSLSGPSGSTETALLKLPHSRTEEDATVTVAVWPRSYSKIDMIDDVSMAMWFDGQLMAQHVTSNSEWGTHIGFAVGASPAPPGTGNATYDNIRIPQLHQIQEWTSVDPGEEAAAGLNRVVGQDLIRVQARYDGSVKIWRNDSTDVDWDITTGTARQADRKHRFHTPNHLRLVGGAHEIDVFRDSDSGHVFVVAQDPHALGEEDTYNRAVRQHKKVEEASDRLTLDLVGLNVLLEPEDVIRFNGANWRVQTIAYTITKRDGDTAVLSSRVECRACLES